MYTDNPEQKDSDLQLIKQQISILSQMSPSNQQRCGLFILDAAKRLIESQDIDMSLTSLGIAMGHLRNSLEE